MRQNSVNQSISSKNRSGKISNFLIISLFAIVIIVSIVTNKASFNVGKHAVVEAVTELITK